MNTKSNKALLREAFLNYLPKYEAFIKSSQQTISSPEKIDIADKLVTQLLREFDPTKYPTPSTSPITASGDTKLDANSLKNLGSLALFCRDHNISYNGQPIAISAEEYQNVTQNDPSANHDPSKLGGQKYIAIDAATSRSVSTGLFTKDTVFVNKDAFVAYIQSLQTSSQQNHNKVMEVMVGKVIDQLKTAVGDDQVGSLTKSTGKNVSGFADEDVVDSFATPVIFNITNPAGDLSEKEQAAKLLVKNLKSRDALLSWFKFYSPSLKDAQGQTIPASNDADDGVMCGYLYVLAQRARLMDQRYPQKANLANYYLKQISELAGQFSNHGKACDLTAATLPKSDNNGFPPGTAGRGHNLATMDEPEKEDQNKKKKNNKSQSGNADASEVIRYLPLRFGGIFFNNILAFCRAYGALNPGGASQGLISQIETELGYGSAPNYGVAGYQIQPEQNLSFGNLSTEQLAARLHQPRLMHPYLSLVIQIVEQTKDLISEFKNTYEDRLSDQDLKFIAAQIGDNGSTSGSAYGNNINALNNALYQIK